MDLQNLPGDSDSSDEDYVPNDQDELPSEEESDGNMEPLSASEKSDSKNRKRKKAQNFMKQNISKQATVVQEEAMEQNQSNELTVEEKKKKDDDLWADFLKDTGFQSKTNRKSVNSTDSKSADCKTSDKKPTEKPMTNSSKTVTVTQIFEYAGEEVKVQKVVPVDSAEARLLNDNDNNIPKISKGKRSIGLVGINNVLNQLAKKPKISTLEKTKLDWDKFKKEENIEEELQHYNKGRDGYLERQDFLERADLRRFEIEREIRTIERNKRFNSSL